LGDYRITIEAVGGHGCGRDALDGDVVQRCGILPNCPDCSAVALVEELQRAGNTVTLAKLEHWPVPGAAGTTRSEDPGPVDDLLTGIRHGSFRQAGKASVGALLVLLLAAGAALACGPALAQVQLGRMKPRPDLETVEAKVCRGDIEDAQRYLEDAGCSRAEREEWIERARRAVLGKPGCECAAKGCRAEGGR
jgi:hypothetical protein